MNLVRIRFVLSLVGLAMGGFAVLTKDRLVTWVAIAVLAVAFGMRFVPGGRDPKDPGQS